MLQFHWQSSGLIALDAINGPTLTIEGDGCGGQSADRGSCGCGTMRTGTPTTPTVTLDFDALDGGFAPAGGRRPGRPAMHRPDVHQPGPAGLYRRDRTPVRGAGSGSATVTNIRCDGSGSVLAINDAVVPEHGLRIATAYDDMYNLPPERIVQAIERLGYRGVINHYVGMSHYFALDGAGKLDPTRTLNSAALAWHRDFARAAEAHGYGVIWSLSYEMLDMFCPEAWKQRAFDGSRGADRVGSAVDADIAGEPRGDCVSRQRRRATGGDRCRSRAAAAIPDWRAVVVGAAGRCDLPLRRCCQGGVRRNPGRDFECPRPPEPAQIAAARPGRRAARGSRRRRSRPR